MTLECFYSWAKSEFKEQSHPVSSCNIPLRRRRAMRWSLEPQSSQSDVRHHTHLTHTQETLVPAKCKSNFRVRAREPTPLPVCRTRCLRPANRLVLCTRVDSCSGVDQADTSCLSIVRRPWSLSSQLGNVMSILLPSVRTAFPFFCSGFQQDILRTVYTHLCLLYVAKTKKGKLWGFSATSGSQRLSKFTFV